MKGKLAARRHSYPRRAQGKDNECFGVVGGEREIYASARMENTTSMLSN
jgi:hypothetical protein